MGHTHDEPSFAASPNTTRTLTECLGSHTNALLLSAKGRGFSFLHFERNKDRALFYERKRKFIFLLSAKGSENDKGGIFRVAPFVNPKTPHTPTNIIFRTSGTTAPLSKGAKGIRQQAEKRDGGKHTSKDEEEIINKACSFAIKADGKECRPLFMNFNFSSLSRARKILRASLANFFGAVP